MDYPTLTADEFAAMDADTYAELPLDDSSSSSSSSDSSESSSSSSDSSSSSNSSSSSSDSSISSESSSSGDEQGDPSSNDEQLPFLDPNSAHNTHPAVLLNNTDRGQIVKVDEMTYRYTEIRNFSAPVTITLDSPYANSDIRYTLNGKNPNPSSRKYEGPLVFRQNASGSDRTVIKARIYDRTNAGVKGRIIRLEFRVLR